MFPNRWRDEEEEVVERMEEVVWLVVGLENCIIFLVAENNDGRPTSWHTSHGEWMGDTNASDGLAYIAMIRNRFVMEEDGDGIAGVEEDVMVRENNNNDRVSLYGSTIN
mmetsp:Transcript_11978/g.21599  ORF Transcript_11978/g.21599 Transcript_11978/m.21599 type:complete len:109 (-) Transcript_11978:53-379(-)